MRFQISCKRYANNHLAFLIKCNEEILSEGYDKSSDSYMFPSGSFNNFSDAVIKENLFSRFGNVLHAPTKEGLIQTVFSTANAAIVNEANHCTYHLSSWYVHISL